MINEITAIKGVKDILPTEIRKWHYVENIVRRILELNCFSEIKIPIFEYSELFSRGIGEVTDIVEKEMYTFSDRDGRKISLRPEGTASVVRAFIEHKLYANDRVSKLYYSGPMFRHERPQAGRYRQFYQIGAEVFGVSHPKVDVEIIFMLYQIFEKIQIKNKIIEINSIGCPTCRPGYKIDLVNFLIKRVDHLCETCQKRLNTNPLRILDCKGKNCIDATMDAPLIINQLCQECSIHFQGVKDGLEVLNIPFAINPKLVRGLDYYTRTAFEVKAQGLGSQNAIAAGGRYDLLIEQLGGPTTPAIGFAIGMERVVSLLDNNFIEKENKIDLFVAPLGEKALNIIFPIILKLRNSDLKVEIDYEKSSLKSKLRRADKLNASSVLIIGDEEIEKGIVILKDMINKGQKELSLANLFEEMLLLRII